MTAGAPDADPSAGAPPADRGRWPVVYRPTARWTACWRVVAVLLGAATVVLVAARVRGPGADLWGVASLVVHAALGVTGAVIMWRTAVWPRTARGAVRALSPGFGPLRDEKLTARMRREIRRPGPLAPELRRPAAVHVLRYRAGAPWAGAVLGLLVVLALLFSDAADAAGLGGNLVLGALLGLAYLSEVRTLRAAVAAGAVPRVAPAHERPGGSTRH